MQEGTILLSGYNRAFSSINELMYVIGFLGGIFLLYQIYITYYKKINNTINMRVLLFITVTSLFVIIPLYQFSGGLFSVITYTMVVNRLYYSSSLFIILPIVVYYIAQAYNMKLRMINIILALTLTFTYIFSEHNDLLSHNYYKNIESIKSSFSERRIGFNLSQKQINIIGDKIKQYEDQNTPHREIKYYARADIAFVLKYMYKKNVNWEGRFGGMNYKKNYNKDKNNHSIQHILFETPKGFPPFVPYR
jgi:hypothetical protein